MRKAVDFVNKIRKTLLLGINRGVEWVRMAQLRRLEASRDDWKVKARLRADELRELRKARRRDRKQLEALKGEKQLLREELEKKRPGPQK